MAVATAFCAVAAYGQPAASDQAQPGWSSAESRPVGSGTGAARERSGGEGDWLKLLAAIAAVTAAIFVLRALLRRANGAPRGGGVVEVVQRAALPLGQQLVLVRFGRRLVLLAVSSHGSRAVCEVSDAAEASAMLASMGFDSQAGPLGQVARRLGERTEGKGQT
jgi:flagellar biogenesis protein FliO